MTFPFNTIPSNNPQNTALGTPIGVTYAVRDPNANDLSFPPGWEWENTVSKTFFKCASATITGAVWIPFAPANTGNVSTVTGNSGGSVPPNGFGNINIVGDGTTITIAGNAGTNTLTASLVGSAGATNLTVDAFTGPGTNPVPPNGSGNITLTGAQVANGVVGTNVIRTNSLAANSATIQIQRSTAVAGTDVTKNGVSHFNSSQFSVDANGFVSSTISGFTWNNKNGNFNVATANGYFVTGIVTATLPAAILGDKFSIICTSASVVTLQAGAGDRIRIGSATSSVAGTATSNALGDSVDLVYDPNTTSWWSDGAAQGTWTLA